MAIRAKLSLAEVEQTRSVAMDDKAATFPVHLPRGPAELRTWFFGHDGTEHGAYFVSVEKMKN